MKTAEGARQEWRRVLDEDRLGEIDLQEIADEMYLLLDDADELQRLTTGGDQ